MEFHFINWNVNVDFGAGLPCGFHFWQLELPLSVSIPIEEVTMKIILQQLKVEILWFKARAVGPAVLELLCSAG